MTRLIRTGRSVPAWPKDALRISFGIIWLIDAVLKWLPGFRSGYMSMLMSQAQGQPGWLKPWFTFWINLQHPRVIFFAYFVAIETLIAVAVIIGFARKLTYISAAVFSVIIWATAEGFGGLFANAPGARVSPAEAARLGSQVPASAVVSPAQHKITFSGTSVRLTVLASPRSGKDETFRIAGMTNPTIVVKTGTPVSIEVINADSGTSHGLVVTASSATSPWMPMMTARPAFTGSALWFLGNPTSAGMHAGTLTFTAGTPGPTDTCAQSPATPRKA